MIKKASFDKEYFVVITLKGKVLKLAHRIQKLIADHYNIYDGNHYPELHITIDRIDKNRVDRASKIIGECTPLSDPIKVKIEDLDCLKIEENQKLLMLDVKNTKSLLKIAHTIHNRLFKKGISTINNYKDWNFHITLINNIFAVNPISDKEFTEICYLLEDFKVPLFSYANKIEIWKPTLDSNKRVIKSFKLKDRED